MLYTVAFAMIWPALSAAISIIYTPSVVEAFTSPGPTCNPNALAGHQLCARIAEQDRWSGHDN